MRNLKIMQNAAARIVIAVVIAVLGYTAFAADLSADTKPVAVDATQYADFMDNEAYDLEDLAEGAEVQRLMFNRMTPPGFTWLQPMFPSLVPFDSENFTDSFLDGLLGEDENSVAIYPLSLVLDPKTRETLVYNAEGKLIASVPAEKASDVWPEGADPARVTLLLDLLPSEDVEPYLYVDARITETLSAAKARTPRDGGVVAKSLGASEFGICAIQKLTNGNMQVTVTNGDAVAETFTYTVLHSASNVVTSNGTFTLWTPLSPSFNGIESDWESGTTNLVLTNGVGVWEDSNISSNDRVRFYAAAKLLDSDIDGLSDGSETFLYRTDPGEADTDGDGHSDGREIALDTDPLDGGDYFGIVINAALPIPPPPGSEVGREWVELFNVGPSPKSLSGFRLQTALPSGWANVFTFPSNTTLDSGDFMLIGNSTNGDYSANLLMPNSSFNPPGMFGIRLVKDTTSFYVADALLYGFTNEYGFSLDGFGEEMPIVTPWTNWVIRRTWIGYDTDHAGDWMKVPAENWTPHTQGDFLDLDGDGLSNSNEMAGGLYPLEGGTRIDETDSDFDGLSDAYELANGLDANNVDTDGDAFPWDEGSPPRGNDADEVANGTDPLDPDTDNDFVPDGWELASPAAGGQKSTGGILDPLSPDTDQDAMPDGDEDSDGDGVPNAVEVANLTNPFDADDVDPRPYLWLKNGQIIDRIIEEGDIGYDTLLTYRIVAQSNCPPIMVRVTEGGHVVESFNVTWDNNITCTWLNPDENPPTNRIYCIQTGGRTSFWFKVRDGRTTWENENPAEYGADIELEHAPALLDLDAGVPEVSEETVRFLLADKSAHAEADRVPLSIIGPDDTWGFVTNLTLTYNTSFLQMYDSDSGGNAISSGTQFPIADPYPDLYVEGIAHSGGMRDAWVQIEGDTIPVSDRVNATVLKADIGTVGPLADRTLHPEAPRVPLQLQQTLPANWNGLMQLAMDGAVAFWTPTGGTPIVLGSMVFTNAQLSQTIYLEGDGCGTNEAVFSVVGLDDCKTNTSLNIFGMNATLDGVAELDEVAPGGFIADRTVHTNAPRTLLTLDACGPASATGNVTLMWNSSIVQIYTAPSGGVALAQFDRPYNGFTTTNLYVEGVSPGSNTLSWVYSEQANCVDIINTTVLRIRLKELSFTNNHTVVKDDSSLSYTAPHWQDNSSPLDGDAVDLGDKQYPVGFTQDTKMEISATWRVEPADPSVSIMVKGDGPGNLDFPETTAAISGNDLTISDVECSNPFVNEVDFFDPMSIAWEFSTDGGSTWDNADTSVNQTYVTLGNPLTTVFHTLAYIGCANADGQSASDATADAIYGEFTDRVVRRIIDNKQMTYWFNNQMGGRETSQILQRSDANGNCESWSALFRDALRVQGLTADRIMALPSAISDGSILVKDWLFYDPPSGTGTYAYVIGIDAIDQYGVPGQGNPDPPGGFNGHWITLYNNQFYDPSYGSTKVTGVDKNKMYEDAALAGYGNLIGTSSRKNDTSTNSVSELDYQVDN